MFSYRRTLAALALLLMTVSACANGPQGGSSTTTSTSASEESDDNTAGNNKPVDDQSSEEDLDDTEKDSSDSESDTSMEDDQMDPADLVPAVVQIRAEYQGSVVWTGSGSILNETNLILTNAHVVDGRSGEYDTLIVAVTDKADRAPVPTYVAEILAIDYHLDLAVLAISEDLGGNTVESDLFGLELGNSDQSDIGEPLTVIGYPGIGGATLTMTPGIVSGFLEEEGLGSRAWIKTDASITGGNSGGAAVNEAGQLIAIPTLIGEVDCRRIVDSNGDGVIDSADPCVPVGGNINPMRPVELATPLIEAAQNGETYVSPYDSQSEVTAPNFDDLVFVNVDDPNIPGQAVAAFPSEILAMCADFAFSGMTDGASWSYRWVLDGVTVLVDNEVLWEHGTSGHYGLCLQDEIALVPGNYEISIYVAGELVIADGIVVGSPATEFVFTNDSSSDFCGLWITAVTAEYWGLNHLTTVLESGSTITLSIAEGTYDIEVDDCNGTLVFEEANVLVDGPVDLTLSE